MSLIYRSMASLMTSLRSKRKKKTAHSFACWPRPRNTSPAHSQASCTGSVGQSSTPCGLSWARSMNLRQWQPARPCTCATREASSRLQHTLPSKYVAVMTALTACISRVQDQDADDSFDEVMSVVPAAPTTATALQQQVVTEAQQQAQKLPLKCDTKYGSREIRRQSIRAMYHLSPLSPASRRRRYVFI